MYIKSKWLTRKRHDHKGNLYVNAEDVGKVFNEYFTAVFKAETDDAEFAVMEACMKYPKE